MVTVPPKAREVTRRVSILGATGSVGTSALDVITRGGERYAVAAVTAHANVAKLAEIAKRHRATMAVVADESGYATLKDALAGSGIAVAAGQSGLDEAASVDVDCTIAAIMGVAGLRPTLRAVRQGRRIALANKECLVAAGAVFMAEVGRWGADLVAVDSEHSGVMQCLAGLDIGDVRRVILTASGGPFRTWDRERIRRATPDEASRHPNWSMGAKITIDSASMMNKGLELIEAHHLFGLQPAQLDVLIHPQSIVHALVESRDGSMLAQLATPDMRLPVALALDWPARTTTGVKGLDLAAHGTLSFEAPDPERFPCLTLARQALLRGGGATAALNAANEVAVSAFLARRCQFGHIADVVERSMQALDLAGSLAEPTDLASVMLVDAEARTAAQGVLDHLQPDR